jgi:catechol 2,3-dioxygenase-like lactoylglutathione lyase family enzyme
MVVLHVEDQEAAKRFWVDTLGFTLAEDTRTARSAGSRCSARTARPKLVLS